MRVSLLHVGLVLCLIGCDQGKSTVSVKDSEGNTRSVSVTDTGGTRTVTSNDGVIKAQGSQGGQNARFPTFAPQYPNGKVQSVVDMTVGKSLSQHTITQFTSDTPDAVMTFYRDKATASGKKVKEINSENSRLLVIGGTSMADMEAGVTTMVSASGGTSINVVLQEKVKN